MPTFSSPATRGAQKATDYFSKMYKELDLDKYKLVKYHELFRLTSFQAMHDSDLAYCTIYQKCACNAHSKQALLNCLADEERYATKHSEAFNDDIYRRHALNAINEIREHLNNGDLNHLYE